MSHSLADRLIRHLNGPFAVTRTCRVCGFTDVLKKRRGVGRGWGLREGNKQRGRLIQHIKETHPEMLEEGLNDARQARTGPSR